MNALITLDYELYFGKVSGSSENCMVKPTNKLLMVLNEYGIKATFFVDVGHIVRADELGCDQESIHLVKEQLVHLSDDGHDIQLHIHPHWEESYWNGDGWDFNLSYYKLSDFSKREASEIIFKYIEKLEEITGIRPTAYRAGGWCIQPFEHFANALKSAGIVLDSTIYADGKNISHNQGFDFTGAPNLPWWRFENDPLKPALDGGFIELPISSTSVSPLFYWKFALIKKFPGTQHNSFGDGSSSIISTSQLIRLLTKRTKTVASIDGFKSSLLSTYRQDVKRKYGENGPLVLIGHPKALTEYSLRQLANYIDSHKDKDQYMTINEWSLR